MIDSTTSSTSSLLGCSQWAVVVIRIENGTETGKCDSMPRFSKRVLFLRHLNGLLNHRLKHRLYRSTQDDDGDSVEEAKDAALASIIKHCEGKRHLFRPAKNRKGRADRFTDDLPPPETVEEATDALEWLTPEEFLQKYRMTRAAFNWVLSQIEDNEEFTTAGNIRKGRPQAPVVHQLMVFLKYIGTEGAGSNSRNQRQMFGIGQGTNGGSFGGKFLVSVVFIIIVVNFSF